MQVLDRYQTRLHQAGNERHDEEIEYVRQIVASPIFQRFLKGEITPEEKSKISIASQNVISADIVPEMFVSELTSSDIQKQRLARRKSLKALRNAVMPHSTPLTRKSQPPFSTSPQYGSPRQSESSSIASGSPVKQFHTKSLSGSGSESARINVQTPVAYASSSNPGRQRVSIANGADVNLPLVSVEVSSSPLLRRASTEQSSSLSGPQTQQMSNSTNTLIERVSPLPETLEKGGQPFSNGRISAEMHHHHHLDASRPEMNFDLFTSQLSTPSGEHFANGSVNPDLHISPHLTHPHLHHSSSPSSSSSHPLPPRSFSSTPQHRLNITNVTESHRHPLPAPPPYSLTVSNEHRRAKSFEELLNSPEFDPYHYHRTPMPPRMTPRLDNPPAGMTFHLQLEKNEDGLGFLVKSKDGREGGLVVQYLSPGGPAER